MANAHLVILKKPYIEAIMDGRKTIESRFIRAKRPPFGCVSSGDRMFLKVSSGPVVAIATAGRVETFENLTPKKIASIRRTYNKYILGSHEYWHSKKDSSAGFLVWLESLQSIDPVWINKKDWRAWVVLTAGKDFGLLTGATGY